MATRRKRTPKIKPGQLMAYYGYAEGEGPDLCVNWGTGTGGSPDGRILCSALSAAVPGSDGKPFFEELRERGYDLDTLRFTIQQKTERHAATKYIGPKVVTQRRSVSALDLYALPIALQAKLGSILVHVDEGSSVGGHHYDWSAVGSLMADREVQDWLHVMRAQGLLPVKRN